MQLPSMSCVRAGVGHRETTCVHAWLREGAAVLRTEGVAPGVECQAGSVRGNVLASLRREAREPDAVHVGVVDRPLAPPSLCPQRVG